MSRATDTHRVIEYWTDKDTHVLFPVQRTEEVDRMSDAELISKYGNPEDGAATRIVH